MKRIFIAIFILIILPVFTLFSQDSSAEKGLPPHNDSITYRNPAEIYNILDKSPKHYEMNIISREEADSLYPYYQRIDPITRMIGSGDNRDYTKFKLSEFELDILSKAETAYQKEDWQNAINFYAKLLENNSDFAPAITYEGQCYEKMNDHESAIKCYRKAIVKNYGDYTAHWYLGWELSQERDSTWLNEIICALLLNRNNREIKKDLSTLLEQNGLKYKDWGYDNLWKIDEVADTIRITGTEDYFPAALCRAYQRYEAGLINDSTSWTDYYKLEKDCVLDSYQWYFAVREKAKEDSTKFVKNPTFEELELALNNHDFEEYYVYEVALPLFPYISYRIPEENFNELIAYFKKYHIEKL